MFELPVDEDGLVVHGEPWSTGRPLGPAADPDGAPPYSVAQCRPSGWLALELDSGTADPSGLDDAELVDAVIGLDRVVAWAAARQARLLAEFARRRPDTDPQAWNSQTCSPISRGAPDEIGLALRASRGTAMARIAQSVQLEHHLPDTLTLWEQGRIDAPRVRAICDAVAFLPPPQATAVQHRVLSRAPDQTPAQLRASLARAVIAVDPDGACRRHQQARTQRRVVIRPEPEGMASLWALLSAPDALASYEWLSRLARATGAQDPRGIDARRADLLVDLLTGRLATTTPTPGTPAPSPAAPGPAAPGPAAPGVAAPGVAAPGPAAPGPAAPGPAAPAPAAPDPAAPGPAASDRAAPGPTAPSVAAPGPAAPGVAAPVRGPAARPPAAPGKPLVHVIVPLTTLTGTDDQPGELTGYGPIPADLAREIAADAVWQRLVTDPLSGALLDHGRTTYRPPQALADFVRARDLRCRSPICRRRAASCELDHAVAWADGGSTSEPNLYASCAHHHHLKHDARWTVHTHPDGHIQWTTPTGHTYPSQPHTYLPEPPNPPPQPEPPDRPPQPEPHPAEPEDLTAESGGPPF